MSSNQTDSLTMLQAQLADALWRERVAECAIRALKDHGTADVVRRLYELRPDQVVIGDKDRPIVGHDILYVLDHVR